MKLKMCKVCKKKTNHRTEEIDREYYYSVCEDCGRKIKKGKPRVRTVKLSDQYEDGVPGIRDEKRVHIHSYKFGNYPHCNIHGALLRYKNNIWRCIECGFAVEYEFEE